MYYVNICVQNHYSRICKNSFAYSFSPQMVNRSVLPPLQFILGDLVFTYDLKMVGSTLKEFHKKKCNQIINFLKVLLNYYFC